jgi:hypothetical protein
MVKLSKWVWFMSIAIVHLIPIIKGNDFFSPQCYHSRNYHLIFKYSNGTTQFSMDKSSQRLNHILPSPFLWLKSQSRTIISHQSHYPTIATIKLSKKRAPRASKMSPRLDGNGHHWIILATMQVGIYGSLVYIYNYIYTYVCMYIYMWAVCNYISYITILQWG